MGYLIPVLQSSIKYLSAPKNTQTKLPPFIHNEKVVSYTVQLKQLSETQQVCLIIR